MSLDSTKLQTNFDQEFRSQSLPIPSSSPANEVSIYARSLCAILTSLGLEILRNQTFFEPILRETWITKAAPLLPTGLNRIAASGIVITIYSGCAVSLFSEPRWRQRYLPWICWAMVVALGIAIVAMSDLSNTFVDGLVGIIDVCIIICLVMDIFV